MTTIGLKQPGKVMADPRRDIMGTLAHHEASITALSSRVGGLELSVHSLQKEVSQGFTALGSKLDRLDAQPRFDFSKAVTTVLSLSVLFSMVVGGIIWVTTSQFSGLIAKQEALNVSLSGRIDKHDVILEKIFEQTRWSAQVVQAKDRR